MLLFFKTPLDRNNKSMEIAGLEVVSTFGRAIKLNLVIPFVAWQFAMKYIMRKIYCIYVIVQNNSCIHASHVIGKGWRIPFMGKADIEIGPCWTAPECRNQGIYSAVIQRILYDFRDRQVWMLCEQDNVASRHGIEKTELKLIAKGKRTKLFGCRILGLLS